MMNTDRELLELAAKAAGVEYFIRDSGYKWEIRTGTPADGYYKQEDDSCEWNPLTDDGDALRLAVKLELDIGINRPNAVCIDLDKDNWIVEYKNSDPYAATRRAIVRAAAEIGKEQP